jgi:hypothetical protein
MGRVKHARGADVPLEGNPGPLPRSGRWCIPHCASKPYANLPREPACQGLPRLPKREPFGADSSVALGGRLAKQAAYFRDGLAALRSPGASLLPATLCAKCVAAWEESLRCVNRAGLGLMSMNSTRWREFSDMPIDMAFTHRKCSPQSERGSLFFRGGPTL